VMCCVRVLSAQIWGVLSPRSTPRAANACARRAGGARGCIGRARHYGSPLPGYDIGTLSCAMCRVRVRSALMWCCLSLVVISTFANACARRAGVARGCGGRARHYGSPRPGSDIGTLSRAMCRVLVHSALILCCLSLVVISTSANACARRAGGARGCSGRARHYGSPRPGPDIGTLSFAMCRVRVHSALLLC
jgi:hypothetical protein